MPRYTPSQVNISDASNESFMEILKEHNDGRAAQDPPLPAETAQQYLDQRVIDLFESWHQGVLRRWVERVQAKVTTFTPATVAEVETSTGVRKDPRTRP